MRNIAVAVLRQLGFPGTAVAALMGVTPNYVATLHQRSLREGTAGLVRQPGRPRETGGASWERARAWRAAGMRDAEIARRLGVNQSTVLRRLGRGARAGRRCRRSRPRTGAGCRAGARGEPPGRRSPRKRRSLRKRGACGNRGGGLAAVRRSRGGRLSRPGMRGRCCCTRSSRGRPPGRCSLAPPGQPGDVALLTAVSMCFALGAATTEQFKHLAAAEAGPLAGLAPLPGLRALRPELARIADAADPLRLQSLFAAAMLAADPVTSGVYYVDDHFVPYTGAKPVAKGWNNKRGRAERGRARHPCHRA